MEGRTFDPGRRGAVVMGVALVLLGGFALVGRAANVDVFDLGWPVLVILPGILLFVVAVSIGGPAGIGLAVPGGIVTMTGLVLAFQNTTGLWATWAYAWALVAPGGVGVGLVLYGLLTRQRDVVRGGIPVLVTGAGLFLGFGLFFEGVLGLSGPAIAGFETVLAAGLVGLGLLVIAGGLLGGRRGQG